MQLLDTGGVGAARRPGLGRRDGKRAAAAVRCLLSGARAGALCRSAKRAPSANLIARHVSVLFLADVGKIAGSDADAVEKFVAGGGVLIRFAGPRMTSGADDLVPVKLRVGGRYLGSAMAWDQPQQLAPFRPPVPFNGLAIPAEVTVSRQILAEPSARTGGPRLGAAGRRHAAGHRQASRAGLDRAVPHHRQSGLVVAAAVGTLCRHAAAAAGAVGRHAGRIDWRGCPAWRRSAAGRLRPICSSRRRTSLPIAAARFRQRTEVSAKHPPGLYGAGRGRRAERVERAGDMLLPLALRPARKAMAQRAPSGAGSPGCWRSRRCCCASMR